MKPRIKYFCKNIITGRPVWICQSIDRNTALGITPTEAYLNWKSKHEAIK